jgi:hypothetical protein
MKKARAQGAGSVGQNKSGQDIGHLTSHVYIPFPNGRLAEIFLGNANVPVDVIKP